MEWTVKQAAAQDHTRPTSLGDIVTTSSPNDSIIARLESIFQEIDQYKALLARRGEEAQTLLNTFQALLDEDAVEAPFRRSLVVAMRRLSKNANLYPQGFEIASIESYGDDPVAGGGYADIYKGRLQGETVCLKTIRIYEPHQVDHLIKKYSREAILWRQLSHPNLLPFFGFTRLRSRLAFVSPWAGNGHVINFLEENPNVDRILLCLDTAAGVSYLHENNVIHGDLKAPSRILKFYTGPPILQQRQGEAPRDGRLQSYTRVMVNQSVTTPASDIYAWGCVCYEIFTGRIPFYKWNRDGAVISQIKLGTRPSQPSRSELAWTEWGLTDRIWDLIIECWKHHPDERPDISTIIERLVQDRQVDPRPPGQWTGSTTRFRRRSYQQPDQEAVKSLLSRVLPSNLELVACECAFASPSSNVRNSNVARRSTIAQATKADKTNTVTPSRLVQELLPTCTSNVEDSSSLAPRSGGFEEEPHSVPGNRSLLHFSKLFHIPGSGLEWTGRSDLVVVLSRHYMLVAQKLQTGSDDNLYNPFGRPIPLDLVTLASSTDTPTKLPRKFFPDAHVLEGSPHTNDMYSLTFRCDGKRPHQLMLYADSIAARNDWKLKWENLKAYRQSINQMSKKFFKMKPLTPDTLFIPAAITIDKSYYYYDRDRTLAGKVTCSVPLATWDGRHFVAVGCEEGVWIGYKNVGSFMRRVLDLKVVTKLGVVEDSEICLVLADKSLYAYRIEDLAPSRTLDRALITSNQLEAPHKNIMFFSVLNLGGGRTFIVYTCKDGPHSILQVFLPEIDEDNEMWHLTMRSRRLLKKPWFRRYRKLFLPDEAIDIIALNTRIAILFAHGGIGITDHDLSDIGLMTIPLYNHIQPNLEHRLGLSRPVCLVASKQDEFLVCYDDFGMYMDIQGTQPTIVEWEGIAERVAIHYPYILVFNSCFIEVRHLEGGRLVQIIKGSDIRCIWDGRGVRSNVAALAKFDAEAQIHAVMDNTVRSSPNATTMGGLATQTVVEVILNNPCSSPYGIPGFNLELDPRRKLSCPLSSSPIPQYL